MIRWSDDPPSINHNYRHFYINRKYQALLPSGILGNGGFHNPNILKPSASQRSGLKFLPLFNLRFKVGRKARIVKLTSEQGQASRWADGEDSQPVKGRIWGDYFSQDFEEFRRQRLRRARFFWTNMESVGNLVEYHYSTYNIASIACDVTPKVLLYGRGFPPSVKLKNMISHMLTNQLLDDTSMVSG